MPKSEDNRSSYRRKHQEREPIEAKASDYIPILEAVHKISPFVGGDVIAKSLITERLKDEVIQSCARWHVAEEDIGPVTDEFPSDDWDDRSKAISPVSYSRNEDGFIELDPEFWSKCQDWTQNQKRWNWSKGLFTTSHTVSLNRRSTKRSNLNSSIEVRRVAGEVMLNKQQLGKLVPNQSMTAPKSPTNSGRTRSPDKWGEWIAEVIIFHHETGITEPMTVNKLVNEIANRLSEKNENALSDTQARPVAKIIVDALRDYNRRTEK